MKNIQINLLRPTKYGRLYCQSEPGTEPFVVFIQNNQKRKRSFFINIDSAIILDLNENFIIQAVEFVIHRKVWKIDSKLAPPYPEIEADIHVNNFSNQNVIIETPVRTYTNENYQYVFFNWGSNENEKKWVSLSKQCYALVIGNSLNGFYIDLSSNEYK